jgi:phosphocarrier protein
MEVTTKVTVLNRLGLHLRAAVRLVTASSKFKCRIILRNGVREADCKSILNLIALAAPQGAEVTILFEGEDAEKARDTILNLFATRFGESS